RFWIITRPGTLRSCSWRSVRLIPGTCWTAALISPSSGSDRVPGRGEPHQGRMRPLAVLLAGLRMQLLVRAVGLHLPRAPPIVQGDLEDLPQARAEPAGADRDAGLAPPRGVLVHPVGPADRDPA